MAIVTQIWEAQEAAFDALVPDNVKSSMTGGVHGGHDVVLHRPIEPGEGLQTVVEGYGSRRGGQHNLVSIRYTTRDDSGALLAEQWWTTVFLNARGDPVGRTAPEHSFPAAARDRPVGEYRIRADEDMPRRYAEVSGDWSVHHFDDSSACRNGFRRRFLHGLCTMGLCAQGLVAVVAGGDSERIRRIAVRFASPTYVGDDLSVHIYEAGDDTYAFDAEAGGAVVIRDGLAELRA